MHVLFIAHLARTDPVAAGGAEGEAARGTGSEAREKTQRHGPRVLEHPSGGMRESLHLARPRGDKAEGHSRGSKGWPEGVGRGEGGSGAEEEGGRA